MTFRLIPSMPSLHGFYLRCYRFIGFLVLTSSMTWLFGYGFVLLFFIFNNTWIAPAAISTTNDKMLTFVNGYQTVNQDIDVLKVTRNQAVRDLAYAQLNRAKLTALTENAGKYTAHVDHLTHSKNSDVADSYKLRDQLEQVRQQTAENLKAHLITEQDAVQIAAQIQQFRNAATDADITNNTLGITTQLQNTQLALQLQQSVNDVATKQETVVAANRSLKMAQEELSNLENTVYYAVYAHHGSSLAFIAYDNEAIAKVGEPIYDCYLLMVVCHKVGVIRKVYHDDEQTVEFPLFNVRLSRTTRGFMVDLDLTEKSAARSTILFVHKPLFL